MSRARVAPVALLMLALPACRRPAAGRSDAPTAVAPAVSAPALPPDRTLPGELAEGSETVGGLVLPRGFRVARSFDGESHALGPASPEQVTSYLRRHLDAAQAEIGPSRTLFPQTRVRGSAGPSLRVEVSDHGSGSELVVTVLKPIVVDPSLSEEERWRRAGLKKEGGLADPQKAF